MFAIIHPAMMEGVHYSWCPLTHKTHDENGNYLYQTILTNASEQLKEILHNTTGMGRSWLCQWIRSSPVSSSLGTELRASVIFSSVSTRTSYLASYLLHCTQCINCGSHWKKQTTSVLTGKQIMSCAAVMCLCTGQCCLSCPARPPVPQHVSTAAAAPDTQQIRENSLIQHLLGAFLKEIGQH